MGVAESQRNRFKAPPFSPQWFELGAWPLKNRIP
jgi:hypothetical protein